MILLFTRRNFVNHRDDNQQNNENEVPLLFSLKCRLKYTWKTIKSRNNLINNLKTHKQLKQFVVDVVIGNYVVKLKKYETLNADYM